MNFRFDAQNVKFQDVTTSTLTFAFFLYFTTGVSACKLHCNIVELNISVSL